MSTEGERYARIKQVEFWLSKGFSKAQIHILLEQKYDLKSYNARNKVLNEAMKEIGDGIDNETIKQMIAEKLDKIAEMTMSGDDKNLNTAIKALESYAKITGILGGKEVKVKDNEITIKFD